MIPKGTIKHRVKPTSGKKEVSSYRPTPISQINGLKEFCDGLYSHSVKFYPSVKIGGKTWHPWPSNPVKSGRRHAQRLSDEYKSVGYVTKIVPMEDGVHLYIRRK